MVVDTSALIAIALREPEWRVLATVIDASDLPMIATVNWVEAGMVMVGKKDDVGALAIVTSLGIEIEGIGRAEAIEAAAGLRSLRQRPASRAPQLRRLLRLRPREGARRAAALQG